MDYDPYVCVLCERPMGAVTQPFWIIDSETLEVKGLAHKGCRDKIDYRTVAYFLTTPVSLWGPGPIGDPPSRELIEFASRMIKFRLPLHKWETNVDFKVFMLAGMTYRATNIEEFLELPKTKELFDWWCSPEHSDPMTQEEVEEVKKRLRENLGEASC